MSVFEKLSVINVNDKKSKKNNLDLWNYWEDGYILPMLKYNIEITRQGDVFIVER